MTEFNPLALKEKEIIVFDLNKFVEEYGMPVLSAGYFADVAARAEGLIVVKEGSDLHEFLGKVPKLEDFVGRDVVDSLNKYQLTYDDVRGLYLPKSLFLDDKDDDLGADSFKLLEREEPIVVLAENEDARLDDSENVVGGQVPLENRLQYNNLGSNYRVGMGGLAQNGVPVYNVNGYGNSRYGQQNLGVLEQYALRYGHRLGRAGIASGKADNYYCLKKTGSGY